MKKIYLTCCVFFSFQFSINAQLPDPALVGYWQNWNDVNSPYIQLDQIDSRYNIIDVSFATPHAGTDYQMEFIPDQVNASTLIGQIQTLQGQGKKVIISMGGASSPISLDNLAERDTFISTMTAILNTYSFDGIDIDFEGSSISISGGTITNPVDSPIINLIYAVKQIMSDYYIAHGKQLILTLAPETVFVQGGMSSYGGSWGGYLPLIDALRDSIQLLHVQLYNSGTMFGIDGNIYTQGTADFIVAMAEAAIRGFTTTGGTFTGLPENKIAIGLPACSGAAGGGFTDTASVKAAINYLRGNGIQPGSYSLMQVGGYPALRGMMTWSINWDAVNSCETSYQFAENFENIFNTNTSLSEIPSTSSYTIYPNPATNTINFTVGELKNKNESFQIFNAMGKIVLEKIISGEFETIKISDLSNGIYYTRFQNNFRRFVKQ